MSAHFTSLSLYVQNYVLCLSSWSLWLVSNSCVGFALFCTLQDIKFTMQWLESSAIMHRNVTSINIFLLLYENS